MTEIKVYRATTTTDVYGDPQPASWALWKTFEGLAGWSNPSEPLEVGRNTVISNRTVLIEGDAPTGILDTDQVEIDGVRYAVDGKVAVWADEDEYFGDQFAVKEVS